jgi:spore coat protein U-like protein
MMQRRILAAALFLLACGAQIAAAQCSVSATAMSLNNYTGAQVIAGNSTVTVTCPILTTSDNVTLGPGTGSGATTTTRMMTGPSGATLGYQIFQNSALTTNWGNTTDIVNGIGAGTQTLTAYPLVPMDQYAIPGLYTDSVLVTVNYVWLFLFAGSATFTMSVTEKVLPNCSNLSASNLAFGNYSGALINSTSTISVTCTNTTPYHVGLNAGLATGATVTTRKMQNGENLLSYSLYSDSGHGTNWGNDSGTGWKAGAGTGAVQTLTVYGQLPAGLPPTPGNYTDTIVATITY